MDGSAMPLNSLPWRHVRNRSIVSVSTWQEEFSNQRSWSSGERWPLIENSSSCHQSLEVVTTHHCSWPSGQQSLTGNNNGESTTTSEALEGVVVILSWVYCFGFSDSLSSRTQSKLMKGTTTSSPTFIIGIEILYLSFWTSFYLIN